MLLRRLTVTALSTAALAAAPAAGAAAVPMPHPVPLPEQVTRRLLPPPLTLAPAGEDRLTVTISNSGNRAVDGRYTLDCHPTGGTHREARAACDRLDEMSRWGEDPFAPVEPRANCTMMYGGPTTARITGTWAGRPVDARFDRRNGCEIARWNKLRPVLPEAGA
ncbi:SSI family serine proteinase inhibitor [Streptomyces sp. 8N616]|uniref:SSI family serine proteinase inhibitor n=1 Tax=Streptomyces sp. 8N616 TaxID=3457414 RepID=UPI003FD5C83A